MDESLDSNMIIQMLKHKRLLAYMGIMVRTYLHSNYKFGLGFLVDIRHFNLLRIEFVFYSIGRKQVFELCVEWIGRGAVELRFSVPVEDFGSTCFY